MTLFHTFVRPQFESKYRHVNVQARKGSVRTSSKCVHATLPECVPDCCTHLFTELKDWAEKHSSSPHKKTNVTSSECTRNRTERTGQAAQSLTSGDSISLAHQQRPSAKVDSEKRGRADRQWRVETHNRNEARTAPVMRARATVHHKASLAS